MGTNLDVALKMLCCSFRIADIGNSVQDAYVGILNPKGFFMEREPNLIISSASRHIVEEDIPFKVDIYKLEGGDGWSLEVVTADGTSIVWDDLFEDDQAAFEEAIATIRKEGAVAFTNGGSNVIPFKN